MPYIKSEYEDLDKYQYNNGDIIYYKKYTKIKHNSYGPAMLYVNGCKVYYINDKYHRLDGPAILWSSFRGSYYINGEFLTKEEFEKHPERLKFLGKEYLIVLK